MVVGSGVGMPPPWAARIAGDSQFLCASQIHAGAFQFYIFILIREKLKLKLVLDF